MTIEIRQGNWFYGIWFCGNDEVDWMAAVWYDPDQKHWRITHRFRYHTDDQPFETDDRKSWHEFKLDDDDFDKTNGAKCGEAFHEMGKMLQERLGNPCDFLDLKTDDDQAIMTEMMKYDWCHARSPGNADARNN